MDIHSIIKQNKLSHSINSSVNNTNIILLTVILFQERKKFNFHAENNNRFHIPNFH